MEKFLIGKPLHPFHIDRDFYLLLFCSLTFRSTNPKSIPIRAPTISIVFVYLYLNSNSLRKFSIPLSTIVSKYKYIQHTFMSKYATHRPTTSACLGAPFKLIRFFTSPKNYEITEKEQGCQQVYSVLNAVVLTVS